MTKRRFLWLNDVRDNDIFKCIVTLKNGMHKTRRFAIDKVQKMIVAVRQLKQCSLLSERYRSFLLELEINPYQIKSCKILNERTGKEFLSL